MPDYTFFLDLDPEVGRGRIRSDAFDRLEQEKLTFHRRVYDGYMKLLSEEPERFIRIDASGTVEEVKEAIYASLDEIFQIRERNNG